MRSEIYPLTLTNTGVTIFDVFISVTGVTSGLPLESVPVTVSRFTTDNGADSPEVRTATTEEDGSAIFRGMQEGWYRFSANHADDGTPRPKWGHYRTVEHGAEDLQSLDQAHLADFLLEPEGQKLRFVVKGFNPFSYMLIETAPVEESNIPNEALEGFHVELTGLDPNPLIIVLITVPQVYPEVIPTRVGLTNDEGQVTFDDLPAIPYRVVAKKMGYVVAEMMVFPEADGSFPPIAEPIELNPAYIPRSLLVFFTHPYIAAGQFLFRDIPVHLEGIKDTSTEGISRTSAVHLYRIPEPGVFTNDPSTNPATPAASNQDIRFFWNLLPGRYRVWINGRSPEVANPDFFPDDDESFVTNPHFAGEITAELNPVFTHALQQASTAELPVRVLPAVIHGRFYSADDASTIKLRGNQDSKPIYKPKVQAGIQFIEFNSPGGNFGQLLPEGPDGGRIVSLDTDANGEFTLTLLPAEYGIKIPTMAGYWGSHVQIHDVNAGTGVTQGWPFSEEWPWPEEVSRPPSNGFFFESNRFPLESGHTYHIDLFVRERTASAEGTVQNDTQEPTEKLVLSLDDDVPNPTRQFSDLGTRETNGDIGMVTFTPTGGGASIASAITVEMSPAPPSILGESDNAVYLAHGLAPGTTYNITGEHVRHTFTGAPSITTPDWMPPGVLPTSMPEPDFFEPFKPIEVVDDLQAVYNDTSASITWTNRSYVDTEEFTGYQEATETSNITYIKTAYTGEKLFNDGNKLPVTAFTGWRKIGDDFFIAEVGEGEAFGRTIDFGGPSPTPSDGPPDPAVTAKIEVISNDDPTFFIPAVTVNFTDLKQILTADQSAPFIVEDFLGSSVVTDAVKEGWVSGADHIRFGDDDADITIIVFMERAMLVKANVTDADNNGAILSSASVKVRNRFGEPITNMIQDQGSGQYAMPGPISRSQALYVDVNVPGYFPFRTRVTAADEDPPSAATIAGAGSPEGGTTLIITVDAALTALPKPTIDTRSFNRFGAFLTGISRTGNETLFEEDAAAVAAVAALTADWMLAATAHAPYDTLIDNVKGSISFGYSDILGNASTDLDTIKKIQFIAVLEVDDLSVVANTQRVISAEFIMRNKKT